MGQLLSITKLTLSSISTDNFTEKNAHKLMSAQEMLDTAATELRQMASLLHAENVIANGLSNAIEREINWLQKSERLHIQYFVEGEISYQLPQQTVLVAYRMIQELLNNIIKHAEATDVIVKLTFVTTALDISISDNGKGFLVNKQRDESTGLGMKTLFHRADMIGANLKLNSKQGEGTTALLHIPYQKNIAHAGTIN